MMLQDFLDGLDAGIAQRRAEKAERRAARRSFRRAMMDSAEMRLLQLIASAAAGMWIAL